MGPSDYSDPISAASCLGYWEMKDEEREMMMQLCPAQWPREYFHYDWGFRAEFQSNRKNVDGDPVVAVKIEGAIRSTKYIKVCPHENECFDNFTGISCALVPGSK